MVFHVFKKKKRSRLYYEIIKHYFIVEYKQEPNHYGIFSPDRYYGVREKKNEFFDKFFW